MNIVIAMAGEGSRFRSAGFSVPKHEIVVQGRSLFEWSLRSLLNFRDHHVVFVGRKDNWNIQTVEGCAARLGFESVACVELTERTAGQADTVMHARPALRRDDSGLLVYNIDTYVEPQVLRPEMIRGAGWLPVFEAAGDKWSFCVLDGAGRVSAVAEKRRISSLASIGLYYFNSFQRFEQALQEYDFAGYKEQFVAPLYEVLLRAGEEVYSDVLPAHAVHVLGTPEDVHAFEESTAANSRE